MVVDVGEVGLVPHELHAAPRRRRSRGARCRPRRCAPSASGALASTTCNSRSASTTSSSVDRNASTSWCGSRRTKPTVSESKHGLAAGKPESARRRIERREQLVLDEHARVRQLVEQRRLARVRVADERDRAGASRGGAPCAASLASRRGRCRSRSSSLDAAQQTPAVDLELRLAGTPGPDAATLLAELRPAAAQTR